MAKTSNRDRILQEGLRVVHEQGFGGASVRDIVMAAGVPQGSFTNHFVSKEAFGLEILDIYFANSREVINRTLRNDTVDPLDRLRAYVDAQIAHIKESEMRNGCLFGNFSAEATDKSEPIRLRLVEIFAEVQKSIEYCLKAAAKAGEIPPKSKVSDVAEFILSCLQGSILLAKTRRSALPVEHFKAFLFSTILR